MSETTNYGFYLTDNNQEKFLDWREKMSGKTDSNMVKIDTVLGNKADKDEVEAQIKGGNVTLLAANWTGTGPWTQTVTIAGTTVNSKVDHTISGDDYETMAAAGVTFLQFKQVNGSVTAEVRGAKPTTDFTVDVTVTEVSVV